MGKKIMSVLLVVLVFLLAGCQSPVDVMDDQAMLWEDQYNALGPTGGKNDSVLDTLDMMLDQYVSGLKKPLPQDIQQTKLDKDDDDAVDHFQSVDNDCDTVEEMKQCILAALTDTKGSVSFYANGTWFNADVLYDVIFNQICEEYMIETMGMQEYSYYYMPESDTRTAVDLNFKYFQDKYTLDQVKDMKDQTLAKAKEVIRDLDLANKSTFEAVELVNQYLCDHCVYPATEPYSCESHSPYGALIEQSAVCEGYARAAQLIFMLCGIDSYYVVGDTPGGGHAWNLVKVDGLYYQLDVTWNDVDSQPNMYFLVTDDYMSLSRTWDQTKYPASANNPY